MKSTNELTRVPAGELSKGDMVLLSGESYAVAAVFTSSESSAIVVKLKPDLGQTFAYVKFSNKTVAVPKAIRRLTIDMSRNEAHDLLRGLTNVLQGKDFSPADLQVIHRELQKALNPTSALTLIGYTRD